MEYYIIPTPLRLVEGEGYFRFMYDTKIVLLENCGEKELYYAKLLSKVAEEKMGFPLKIIKGKAFGANEIIIEKLIELQEPADDERTYKIKRDSYNLSVSEQQIAVQAYYANGILYGVETLIQLINQLGMVLPCLTIEDRPQIPNRGFYHDATRGRIQNLSEYKKLADKCAYYKLNQLQLYVEHSYMFRDFSEVWRDDTPLTASDILELDAYCKELGIELIPSIASFGHLDKVLKTKSFTRLCELPDSDKDEFSFRGRMEHHTINMTDPEAWDFIRKMLDEFIPLFSSRQFNLCGDETFDLGKGKSKSLADEIGTHRIYVDFVKKICEYLCSKGLRPMFWGDIIVNSPELIKELPKETVCLTWGYSEEESETSAKTMDAVGATQYLCPGVHGWRHFINRYPSAYANISRMSEYAKKYHALGLLNTDWGDYGHVSHPGFSIPGLIYGAEGAWGQVETSESLLNKKISLVEFGDAQGKIMDILSDLSMQEAATWNDIVNIYEFMKNDSYSMEEKQAFWSNQWLTAPEDKNQKINELQKQLSELSNRLYMKDKSIIYSYLLHSRGQELFNEIVAVIGDECVGTKLLSFKTTKEDRWKLASQLETWFMDYKNNWRLNSRESELYRVQDVVFWYADMLRQIP